MTRTDRKKLAKAARELAFLYAEGRGPRLAPGSWCRCAAGQVFRRARLPNGSISVFDATPAERMDSLLDFCLTEATEAQCTYMFGEPTPGAVVFPLLWLADELESQP